MNGSKNPISSITMKGVATYANDAEQSKDAEQDKDAKQGKDAGQKLKELKKVNFIFGNNSTGKTTISRYLAALGNTSNTDNNGSNEFDACSIEHNGDSPILVYNSDFVKANFQQSDNLKGVFTLGEESVGAKAKIDELTAENKQLKENSAEYHDTIKKEEAAKDEKLYNLGNALWNWEHRKRFPKCFIGYGNSKKKIANAILEHASNHADYIKSYNMAELQKEYDQIHTVQREKIPFLPQPTAPLSPTLISIASNPLLSTVVQGNTENELSALIDQLQNQDWVKQGTQFHQKTDSTTCPFCQQHTPPSIAASLADYFDETFANNVKSLKELHTSYENTAKALMAYLDGLTPKIEALVDQHKLIEPNDWKRHIDNLRNAFDKNIERLKSKHSNPSSPIALEDIDSTLNKLLKIINKSNSEIDKWNKSLENTNAEEELKNKVWSAMCHANKPTIDNYNDVVDIVDEEIESLNKKIAEAKSTIQTNTVEISKLNKDIAGVDGTIDDINRLLQESNFVSFKLAKSGDNSYQIIRDDGTPVKDTLSEGESSFIAFLYFYHLITGSHSATTASNTEPKVVVIDDPVSSLDSQALFTASALIKDLSPNKNTNVAQLFVLTHNIYFHHEVSSYGMKGKASYHIVSKPAGKSIITCYSENPIQTSYTLLWQEVCELRDLSNKSSATILNVMRRILEHYFKYLGNKDVRTSIEKLKKLSGTTHTKCSAFYSNLNNGSHGFDDDVYNNTNIDKEKALDEFEELFKALGHADHYSMMMEAVGTINKSKGK